jgi:hypothetical protein
MPDLAEQLVDDRDAEIGRDLGHVVNFARAWDPPRSAVSRRRAGQPESECSGRSVRPAG